MQRGRRLARPRRRGRRRGHRPGCQGVAGQLEARSDDLLAALGWFVDAGRTDEALRLANALYRFWITKQRFEEGAVWFDRVLGSPGGDDRLRGKASLYAGFMPFWLGDDGRAAELLQRRRSRSPGDSTMRRWSRRRSVGWPASRCAPTSPKAGGSPARRSRSARRRPTNPGARTRCISSASAPRSPATCRRPATG